MLRNQKRRFSPKKIQVKTCNKNESSCDYYLSIYGNLCDNCPQAPKPVKSTNLIRKLFKF